MAFELDETEEDDEPVTPEQIADHLVSIFKRAEKLRRDAADAIVDLYLSHNNTSTQRLFD